MTAVLARPEAPAAYQARCEGFEGSLLELAAALRAGRVPPAAVPLARLAREVLERYRGAREVLGLDAASEALPHLAAVVELKARLLLPAPPRDLDADDADAPLETVLAGVEALARLEGAIEFLRGRRRDRARLIAPPPARLDLPRRERPLGKSLGDLVAAARRRVSSLDLGELSLERLTLAEALGRLRALGRRLGRFLLSDAPAESWAERTVLFAALLEGIKAGDLEAAQAEPFADIEVRARA